MQAMTMQQEFRFLSSAGESTSPVGTIVRSAFEGTDVARPRGTTVEKARVVCVPKTKSERIVDEVRPRWRTKLWRLISEPDERPAHPFAKTDAF